MTILELALVTLVTVWTVLFCLLGVAGFYVLREIRHLIARVDRILESTQAISEDARAPFEALAIAVRKLLSSSPKSSAPVLTPVGPPLEVESGAGVDSRAMRVSEARAAMEGPSELPGR